MNIPSINWNNNDTAKGFLAGTIFGMISGAILAKGLFEKKLQEEVAFQLETIENAYNAALALRDASDRIGEIVETRHTEEGIEAEIVLDKPISTVEAPDYLGEVVVTPPHEEPVQNPYHQAVEAIGTPVEQFIDGGVNDYGISYIEEEDYQDEDGRFKGKIDIILSEDEPVFVMDGEGIDDWDTRIGDSILVDMFRLCPPGTPPILYVRNHRTDEDYEVVRVEP